MDKITIAYFTCRKDPKIEWFFRSLDRELKSDWSNINILIVDYHHQFDEINRELEFKKIYEKYVEKGLNVKHVAPKPTPYQGKYKITKNNYFAASNARNTAFLHCDTSYIVCIDDLTVIKEGWLEVILWAKKNNFIVYGSYAKVKNLTCDELGNYTYNPDINLDSRFNNSVIDNNFATKVAGSWLFGCSFGVPMEYVYKTDGFDESCDTIGAEDYDFGIRLGRLTENIYYSRQMFTYEDDDLHFSPGNIKFSRIKTLLTDKTKMKHKIGIMSDHAMLQHCLESNSPLPFTPTNLLSLRHELQNDELLSNTKFRINEDLCYWTNGEYLKNM